jgi:UDP-N-acetylglucosamine/UDP-N-acetylgalactosamine diphosphorylase
MKNKKKNGVAPEIRESLFSSCGPIISDKERKLYLEEIETFEHLFRAYPSVFTSTPGRICLIGEHVDYFGGDVVTAAINNFITVYIRFRDDDLINLDNINERFPSYSTRLPLLNERTAAGGDWQNYVLTVFYLLSERVKAQGVPVHGMDLLVGGNLMPEMGLSSSAALQVGVGEALNIGYGLSMNPQEVALLAQDSEVLCNQDSGIMDQMAVINARKGEVLVIDCMAPAVSESLQMSDSIVFVALPTGVQANKAESEYNLRIAGGLYALKTILLQLTNHGMTRLPGFQKSISEIIAMVSSGENLESLLRYGCSLKTIYSMARTDDLPLSTEEIIDLLPIELSLVTLNKAGITIGGRFWSQPENRNRLRGCRFKIRNYIRHALSEMARTEQFLDNLRRSDFPAAGTLMKQTHDSLVNDYEVGWDEGNMMVSLASECGAHGARQVGAGFGGSVIAMVDRSKAPSFSDAVKQRYLEERGIRITPMMIDPDHGTIGCRFTPAKKKMVVSRLDMLALLQSRGVEFPDGTDGIRISGDVDPDRIEVGVRIHRGSIVEGSKTLLRSGACLGLAGGGYFKDVVAGKEVQLQGGFFDGAVFLQGSVVRSGAEIRPGTLLCEQVNVAQGAGLKMSIVLEYSYLGSIINFCDVFVQAGHNPEVFTEVGSGAIHFNNTMHLIKFPSLIGDVLSVFHDSDLIFIGGATKLIGPCIIRPGAVVAAGSRVSRNVEGNRLYSESSPAIDSQFSQRKMKNLERKLDNVLQYMANVSALREWFRIVRMDYVSDALDREINQAAIEVLSANLAERILWLEKMAKQNGERDIDQKLARLESTLCQRTDLEASGRHYILEGTKRPDSATYSEAIRSLPQATVRRGKERLGRLLDNYYARAKEAIGKEGLFQ